MYLRKQSYFVDFEFSAIQNSHFKATLFSDADRGRTNVCGNVQDQRRKIREDFATKFHKTGPQDSFLNFGSVVITSFNTIAFLFT